MRRGWVAPQTEWGGAPTGQVSTRIPTTPDSTFLLHAPTLSFMRAGFASSPICGHSTRNDGPQMVRPTRQPPCAHPSTRRLPRPTAPSLLTGCAIGLGGRWNAKPSSALRCPTHFQLRPLPMVRAPCPIAADEPRRALDDGDSLERQLPDPIGWIQADANVRSGRANAPPARGPTPDPRTPARPHAPLSLYARRPISSCR